MKTIGVCIPGVCLTLSAALAQAQLVTDGSLGAATTLTGPNFLIDDALGQERGGNLFHSFSTFNIALSSLRSSTPRPLRSMSLRASPARACRRSTAGWSRMRICIC